MGTGVSLDTSFLITLAGRNRAHHDAARRYWRYFLEHQIAICFSTIVISESAVKQEIPLDIMRACIPLPFNHEQVPGV
jgi:hypothetical protein